MKRTIFITAFLILVFGLHLQGQVVINEFMASNRGRFLDSLGRSSDWVELYNGADSPVSLDGWYLSDNIDLPGKWTFPNVAIGAHDYLVVFASGDDLFDGYHYHTNFKLDADGEEIILSNGSREILDRVQFDRQFPNISQGRLPDGEPGIYLFDPGTPGYSNQLGIITEVFTSEITASIAPGFYPGVQQLVLTTANPDLEIHYTFNGESPDLQDQAYTGPIELSRDNFPEIHLSHIPTGIGWRQPVGDINQCLAVRAQAFQEGFPVGREYFGSFFVEDKGDDRYSMPVMSIMTDPRNLFDPDTGIYHIGLHENYYMEGPDWERSAHIEYFEDGDLVLYQDVGMRITGRISRLRPQKSLKLYARSEYGKARLDFPFFDEKYGGEFKRITLRALSNNATPTGLTDDLAHQVSYEQDLDYEYQRRKFAVVFINGEYWGVHSLRESTDKYLPAKRFDYPVDDVVFDEQEYLHFVNHAASIDMSRQENFEWAAAQMDVDNLIDYYIAELFFVNFDFPQNNVKAWKLADQNKWRWIFFDLDRSMQQYRSANFKMLFEPEELYSMKDELRFFKALLQNEGFREQFKFRLIYHLNNTFSPDKTTPVLQRVVHELEPEIKEHQRRWNYPGSIRRWRNSINNTADFLIARNDIFLTEIFEKLGIPMLVFPNPAYLKVSGELQLAIDQQVSFYLTSMDGKMNYIDHRLMIAGKNIFSLDMADFPSGAYLLSAITEHQIYTAKVMLYH